MKNFILFSIFVVVALLSIFALSDIISQKSGNDWYAVKIADGTTYYGHIEQVNERTLTLSDVYSIELVNAPAVSESQNFQVQTEQKKIYNLIHHASDPSYLTDNKLIINVPAIMFWEKLGNTSQIVELIQKSKK